MHSSSSRTHRCRVLTAVAYSSLSRTHRCRVLTAVAYSSLSRTHRCRVLTAVAYSPLSRTHRCRHQSPCSTQILWPSINPASVACVYTVTSPSLLLFSTPLNMSLCMCNGSIIIYSFSYHAPADTMTLVAGGKQQIFTSPNQPHLPNVPPPSFDLPQSSTAFFKPLWNLEKYPYLAFIPKNPTPSSSSLTARLATEPKKMLLCFDSGRWSLQPATITAWKSLEKNLVTATTGLFAFATKRYPGHDTVLYPHRSKVPSNYSYDRAFVDKEELLATLESARRAFFIEMRRCSYALALTFDPKDPSARPWLDML